jgi:hypothetical protein
MIIQSGGVNRKLSIVANHPISDIMLCMTNYRNMRVCTNKRHGGSDELC